ncbi:6583_t:CDS:2 [Rhizophagus irregularis]|nr:6583_t:CDS:2 [Rhizophagus irregularis]
MIPIEYEPPVEDARVVIGIDFGTTFSGFSFAYIKPEKEKIEIVVNDNWLGIKGPMKTNTVLQYDEDYEDVIAWGAKALAGEPSKKAKNNQPRPVELFKLHLGDVPESKKPKLPDGITPERAITDYLREMGFSEKTKSIMRKCLFDAGLIKRIGTLGLQFTTEPEAAAIHCMSILKEHGLSTGAKYLIVDCGGGTVDLTVRKLLPDNKLGETTMRSEDFCGGSYVDDKFLEFLEKKVSKSAMNELKEKNYGQVNYMVQQFCFHVKIPFTGEESDFGTFEWDIERKCPALKKYVTGSEKNKLREDDWIIDLDFKTVKGFFDPVIDKILKLIKDQLKKCPDCSMMYLVGGFSESKYLQTRVKQAFEHKIKIAVPPRPVIAVVSGACEYGLDTKAVSTRVLKWTYGVLISPKWQPGDPPSRKDSNGRIDKFFLMAEKEVQVDVDKEFSERLYPSYPNQTSIDFCIYYTSKYSATYCDEPEMNFLATNETNRKVYRTTFCSTE